MTFMKRLFTATCLAATFAVGLAAQSTGTSGSTADPQQTAGGGQRAGGPRTVTGCLRAGDTAGTYMLTDVQMQGAGGTTAGSTTTGGSATTTGTAGSGAATTASGQRPAGAPSSIMLTPDSSVDLKAHVGHKIEVTGTMAGGRNGGAGAATTTGGGTATTTGGSTATTTGGGTTTGATTTGAGQTAGTQAPRGPRNMNVTSIRMISESCS
jgi:hypothetical protein